MSNSRHDPTTRIRRKQIAIGMGAGIALGVALGAALGNVALGLVFGILIGGAGSIWRIKTS